MSALTKQLISIFYNVNWKKYNISPKSFCDSNLQTNTKKTISIKTTVIVLLKMDAYQDTEIVVNSLLKANLNPIIV